MGRIMWSQAEDLYRGQALMGAVITIDEPALQTALKHAGNSVFDTEWWVETLTVVMDRWGLKAKQWTDPATQVLRIHYRTSDATQNGSGNQVVTGPLTTRLLSGPLNSGRLGSGMLNPDRLGDRR
ncbi:MAG: hypothetical protein ABI670_14775 [Chloroflexota bacterium]